MPSAFNDDTGELLVLDNAGKWVKPLMAANPQTGEQLYQDGDEWKAVPLSRAAYNAGAAASVLQGPLMGAGDEVVAALENPISAAKAAFDGENADTKGYYQSLRRFRGIENRFRQENPMTGLLLTGAGSLAGGGVQLGRAAFNTAGRLLPRAGALTRAGVTGAAFGAPAGFASGEGTFLDRVAAGVFGLGAGAALGTTFEAATPVLSTFVRSVIGNPRLWNEQAGQLTPAGVFAARRAGINPDEASEALQREFATEARNALQPAQAAAVSEARALPVPVQLRRGQVTLRPEDQMFESQAAKDVYGRPAGIAMRDSEEAQQAALRENIPAIGSRIGGGQVSELGQGVGQAQTALAEAERVAKSSVNQLYDEARTQSRAFVTGADAREGMTSIMASLNQRFAPEFAPRVYRILQQRAEAFEGGGSDVNVADLFNARRQLATLAGSSDSVEATAAGQAKRAFDSWLNDAIDGDLINGDRASIDRWRRAIGARREYGDRFQGGDLVEKLVARQYQGGRSVLRMDPNAAVNLIFGRAATGWTSRPGLVRDLMRVRSELGADSAAWNALREEAFLRFARAGEGASGPMGRDFSGANFAKGWEDSMRTSPEVVRLLFTDRERALISQFASVARRVTTPVRGGVNTSNTSAALGSMVTRLFASAFMGPKMAAFLDSVPVIKGLANIGNELRAQSAIRGRLATGAKPVEETRYGLPAVVQGGLQSPPARQISGDFSARADAGDRLALATSPVPVVGDVAGAANDVRNFAAGRMPMTAANMGLATVGILPFIPGASAYMRPAAKAGGAAPTEGIRAFHGSPHEFDRFDISKVGAGEGNQVYGHGLYFADKEEVAKYYRDSVQGRAALKLDGADIGHVTPAQIDDLRRAGKLTEREAKALRHLDGRTIDEGLQAERNALSHLKHPAERAPVQARIEALEGLRGRVSATGRTPNLYEVRLNTKPDELIDWDVSLATNPSKVGTKLEAIADKYLAKSGGAAHYRTRNAAEFVQALNKQVGALRAAAVFRQAGVKGLRYFDQGSRAAQEGFRNYVIFDDKIISILRRYGVPMAALGGGAAAVSARDLPPEIEAQLAA